MFEINGHSSLSAKLTLQLKVSSKSLAKSDQLRSFLLSRETLKQPYIIGIKYSQKLSLQSAYSDFGWNLAIWEVVGLVLGWYRYACGNFSIFQGSINFWLFERNIWKWLLKGRIPSQLHQYCAKIQPKWDSFLHASWNQAKLYYLLDELKRALCPII